MNDLLKMKFSNAAKTELPADIDVATEENIIEMVLLALSHRNNSYSFDGPNDILNYLNKSFQENDRIFVMVDPDKEIDAWVNVSNEHTTDTSLYIDADAGPPEARHKLLAHMIDFARTLGMKEVETTLTDPMADNFYSKTGFRQKPDSKLWVLALDKAS